MKKAISVFANVIYVISTMLVIVVVVRLKMYY